MAVEQDLPTHAPPAPCSMLLPKATLNLVNPLLPLPSSPLPHIHHSQVHIAECQLGPSALPNVSSARTQTRIRSGGSQAGHCCRLSSLCCRSQSALQPHGSQAGTSKPGCWAQAAFLRAVPEAAEPGWAESERLGPFLAIREDHTHVLQSQGWGALVVSFTREGTA